jgi:hypothetical protein
VVVRATPFNNTSDPEVKFEPFAVMVTATPADVLMGAMELNTGRFFCALANAGRASASKIATTDTIDFVLNIGPPIDLALLASNYSRR